MHLRTKLVDGHPYLYAVDTTWNAGNPRVAFQAYLGKPDQLAGHDPRPLVRTFNYGAVAVLLEVARQLQISQIVDQVVGSQGRPSVGEYLLLAALNRCLEPHSKRAFAEWYERTSLKRLLPVPANKLTSQRFWDAMDQVSESNCQEIFLRVARAALQRFDIRDDALAFDCTNFFTFIASGNTRPKLPLRGHSKAHRNDLRQVGLALAVSRRDQLPLFGQVYAGDRNDATIFNNLFPHLVRDLSELGQGEATWIYDKGNVSQRAQLQVEAKGIPYVTSVPPSYYPDLLAIDLAEMVEVDADAYPNLQGHRVWSTIRKRWSRELQLVMSHSPELARGQLRGVLQHRDKALRRLTELQAQLARRTPESRGRKPTLASVQRQLDRILSAQHLRRLIRAEPYLEGELVRLRFELDDAHLEHLTDHLFGRRIWLTTHLDWTPSEVVHVAHQQASAEACFRQLHDPDHVAWQPMYHWTDQKIRVHGLYCLIALLLVQLLRLLARRAGDQRATDRILADLDHVEECLVVPVLTSVDQRPHLERGFNTINPDQRRLMTLVGISA